MKRKILTIIAVLVLILIPMSAYAEGNEGIAPCYNVIASVDSAICVVDSGIEYDMCVYVGSYDALDSAYITTTVKRASGVTVGTYSGYMTNHGGFFLYENTVDLNNKGVYHVEYTIRCYKNGSVVDTVSESTINVTYEP